MSEIIFFEGDRELSGPDEISRLFNSTPVHNFDYPLTMSEIKKRFMSPAGPSPFLFNQSSTLSLSASMTTEGPNQSNF